jgi:hypothetical protein
MAEYGMRNDGKGKKYTGWLGEQKRIDNPKAVSTEISIGTNINGKEVEIPLMVPTLDKKELKYLLSVDPEQAGFFDKMPKTIINKAVEHANMRMQQGKSPFKEPEDDM